MWLGSGLTATAPPPTPLLGRFSARGELSRGDYGTYCRTSGSRRRRFNVSGANALSSVPVTPRTSGETGGPQARSKMPGGATVVGVCMWVGVHASGAQRRRSKMPGGATVVGGIRVCVAAAAPRWGAPGLLGGSPSVTCARAVFLTSTKTRAKKTRSRSGAKHTGIAIGEAIGAMRRTNPVTALLDPWAPLRCPCVIHTTYFLILLCPFLQLWTRVSAKRSR